MAIQTDTAFPLDAASAVESHSAVSWGAVFAGAVAGLACAFVLITLFAGFGLRPSSPWLGAHGDPLKFTPMLGAAMILIQVLSSALGGYLAGRLRTRWTHVHGHEVHFRDTAHGLLSWSLATLVGAALAGSMAGPLADQASLEVASNLALSNAAALGIDPAALAARIARQENLAAQYSLFLGVGLLLGAFTAAVAAAVGGLRREDMHTVYWKEAKTTVSA